MIIHATEAEGPQIEDITLRIDGFSDEHFDALGAVWEEYLILGAEDSGYDFLVDRDGDTILGFACYGRRDLADGVFDLYYIAVDPDCRRQGAGRRLLEAGEAAAREAGARMMIVEASGTSEHEPTRAFYQDAGYRVEATIKDFYSAGDDLAVFIKRF
jgi:ribosomal protein S18 acetylase RimI-like enzyme